MKELGLRFLILKFWEHALEMNEFGIEFEILAYDTLNKTWKLSNSNLFEILVKLILS